MVACFFFRASFGTRNPLYVKTLINYVNFAVDFRADDKAVEVARVSVRKKPNRLVKCIIPRRIMDLKCVGFR